MYYIVGKRTEHGNWKRRESRCVLQLLPPLMDDVTSGQVSSADTSGSSVTAWLQALQLWTKHLVEGSLFTDVSLQLVVSVSNYSAVLTVLSSPSENCAVCGSTLPAQNAGRRTEPDGTCSRGVLG